MAYSTINKGASYFNPVLFSGNSGTQSITGVGFKPDWVWNYQRSSAGNSRMFDAVRGAPLALLSGASDAEASQAGVSSFDTDGFTTGSISNSTGQTYVTWNWLAANSTTSNTSGTITSTVSANTTSGFSIVSWTGTGATATVGHGLGTAPSIIIPKNRTDAGTDWYTYWKVLGNTNAIRLNNTGASAATGIWNNTSPTSSVFSVVNNPVCNASGKSYIAYCFAEIKGYSKIGSYTGNGSTDGTFVYTGFKPAYIMTKISSTTGKWFVQDNKRDGYNATYKSAIINDPTVAEDTNASALSFDFLSNGFKLRNSYAELNASGATYIYMTFAENPFVLTDGTPVTAR